MADTDADEADSDPLSSILEAVTDLRDQVDDLVKTVRSRWLTYVLMLK